MAGRYKSIIIGAALGLAAMPVIMALAWGLLLASGCVQGVTNINGFQSILPWAGLFSLFAAVVSGLFLIYQGYRLDQRGLLSKDPGNLNKGQNK